MPAARVCFDIVGANDSPGKSQAGDARPTRRQDRSGQTSPRGHFSISTARRALIENAAVFGAVVQDMGAKWISGGQVDLNLYSTLSGHCVVEKFDRYEAVWMRSYYRSLRSLKGNCCYESKSLA
jgi:hypothetical protein